MNKNFPWKRPIISMNYFKQDFQKFWPPIINIWRNKYFTEHMSYRTVIFEQNYHWLAACGIFLFSKIVYTWLLILHARIQSLKESGVVAMESFSIELIEVIVHKCSKKRGFWNIRGTYKKTTTAKYNFW